MKQPSLSRSAGIMAIGTVLSRITGFVRNATLIAVFGLGAMADTYTLANNVPNIVYELVVGGVLSATLVPVFSRIFTTEDDESAWRAVSAVFTITAVAIAVLSVVVVFAAPLIIDLYTLMNNGEYAESQKETATFLLRLFAPQIAMYGFVSIATGLLNSKRLFGPPMYAPIFNNVVVIAMLLSLPLFSPDRSLEAMLTDTRGLLILGLGTTAGVIAMALVLIPYVKRASQGRMRLLWDTKNPAVRSMLKMSGWAVGFVIANQIALGVVFVLATPVEGGLTTYMTAYMFFVLPHAVFSVSVMSALQPELAEHWTRNAVSRFVSRAAVGIRMLTLIIGASAVFFCFLAEPIMQVFIANGLVTADAASDIGRVLVLMSLGLPGFSMFLFFTRTLQAMHEARKVFYLYVFENALNVGTAIAFFQIWGIEGLALSHTVAYSIAALAALMTIRYMTKSVGGSDLAKSLLRTTGACVVAALALLGITQTTLEEPAWLQLTLGGAGGLLAFLLAAKFIASTELALILRIPRRQTPPDNSEESLL